MTKQKHPKEKFELPIPEKRSNIKLPDSRWSLDFPDEDRDRIVDEDSHNNPPEILHQEEELKKTLNMKQEAKEVDYKVLNISSVFNNNDFIPAKYTCDGENISPPLEIGNIPKEAKCLAIIVDDPDAPSKTWVHWVCWNIPVTHQIKENEKRGEQGLNDFGKNGYGGPCPPKGTHRYFFKIYALDQELNLPGSTTKADLEKAMSDHIIGFGDLFGLYEREK